jgi:hypothetical protein
MDTTKKQKISWTEDESSDDEAPVEVSEWVKE